MIDFPITMLLDDGVRMLWLERHLHPEGLKCPDCRSMERCLFREQGHFPAYRCRVSHGDYPLLIRRLCIVACQCALVTREPRTFNIT
jgi:hypothetical protein